MKHTVCWFYSFKQILAIQLKDRLKEFILLYIKLKLFIYCIINGTYICYKSLWISHGESFTTNSWQAYCFKPSVKVAGGRILGKEVNRHQIFYKNNLLFPVLRNIYRYISAKLDKNHDESFKTYRIGSLGLYINKNVHFRTNLPYFFLKHRYRRWLVKIK